MIDLKTIYEQVTAECTLQDSNKYENQTFERYITEQQNICVYVTWEEDKIISIEFFNLSLTNHK